MSTKPLRYAGLIALTTVLAACDDGGGGGGSSDPDFTRDVPQEDTEVKEENAEEVTDSSLRSADTIIGQGASGGGYGTPTIRSASEIPGDDSLVGSVHRFVEAARDGSSGVSTRATQSDTVNCDSGSWTYSYTYPDNGDTTTQGAEWSMDFDNCVLSDTRYDGGFTMTFEDGYDTDTNTGDWEASWKLDYDDYRSENASSGDLTWRAHGDMKLTFGSQTDDSEFTSAQQSFYYLISGDSFYVAYDDEVAHNRNYRLEYRIGASGDYLFAYDTQASTTGTGGWITVETTEKFEWSSGGSYPFNGELYVAGGQTDDPTQPSYVRLTAVNQGGSKPQYYVDSGSGEVGPETFENWGDLISEL